jgi:hypothetical protein
MTLRSRQSRNLVAEYIIYPTDLELSNTLELLTEIPQNRYLKYIYIIIHI